MPARPPPGPDRATRFATSLACALLSSLAIVCSPALPAQAPAKKPPAAPAKAALAKPEPDDFVVHEKDRHWLTMAANNTIKPINPADCTVGDKRYIYWAANRHVFKFKYCSDPRDAWKPRGHLRSPSGKRYADEMEVPPPPDPSEPEGCYLNPLRAGAIPYFDRKVVSLFREIWGRGISQKSDLGRIRNVVPASLGRWCNKMSSHPAAPAFVMV